MKVYDGTYWSNDGYVKLYIATASSLVGLPLMIYLHFKHLVPGHLNFGAYLTFIPFLYMGSLVSSFKTTAFIEEGELFISRRLFENIFKSISEPIDREQITSVEIVSDWQSKSCNFKLANNAYLGLINVDPQFEEWITQNFNGKIREKNVTEKQSYKVGMFIILGVIIYILLLFAVTFLATANTVP